MSEPVVDPHLNVGDGGEVIFQPATLAQTLGGETHLARPSARGTFHLLRFPAYRPETDLQPIPPAEILAAGALPEEHWPRAARRPLLNIGGHRAVVLGQEITFDASFSQGDEDTPIDGVTWNLGDGTTASGIKVTHTYAQTGFYDVTATLGSTTTKRYVRVLAALGESDAEVIAIPALSGTLEQGWRATVVITGQADDWEDHDGVMLYVVDHSDGGWRGSYEGKMRDLARRTAYTANPPPVPEGADVPGLPDAPRAPTGGLMTLGNPSGGCWPAVNTWNSLVADAALQTATPGNLLKAIMALESCGDPGNVTATGNPSCPRALGLMQIAQGCSWYGHAEKNLFDPAQNILAGAQELRARYDACGSWEGALSAYFSGDCVPDGSTDILGTEDRVYVRRVLELWAEAEAAVRGLGGGGEEETYGDTLFMGYVLSGSIQVDADRGLISFECVGTGEALGHLMRRDEAFFESGGGRNHGGTFMDGPPMRIAQCIHHTLTEHSNFAEFHDVLLDWSGPRIESTTALEGTMLAGFRQWANNDFAHIFSDRQGRLRYLPRAHYRGKTWYEEAGAFAPVIDPGLVVNATPLEREMSANVTWVKLTGTMPYRNCQVYGEYPCGGPPPGPAGRWVHQTGYQYDDYNVLCAMAAHHYAYLNRDWDLQLVMPWRHDLELGDVVRIPLKDEFGRFDWRAVRTWFVVTGISCPYDPEEGSWLTTVSLEQLTYGVPCECAPPECHTPDRPPCPTCRPGAGGIPGGDRRPGDPICGGQSGEVAGQWRRWTSRFEEGCKDASGIWLETIGDECPFRWYFYRINPVYVGHSCVVCGEHSRYYDGTDVCMRPSLRIESPSIVAGCIPTTRSESNSEQIPGVLEAKQAGERRDYHSHATTGESDSRSWEYHEQVQTWIELTAIGPPGASRIGTLWLRPTPLDPGDADLFGEGRASVVVVPLDADLDGPEGVDHTNDLVLTTPGPNPGPLDASTAYDIGEVVSLAASLVYTPVVDLTVTPTLGSGWLSYPLSLPCSPRGKRYRIGLKLGPLSSGGGTSEGSPVIKTNASVIKQVTYTKQGMAYRDTGCEACTPVCVPTTTATTRRACFEGGELPDCAWLADGESTSGPVDCPDYANTQTIMRLTTTTVTTPTMSVAGAVRAEARVVWEGCRWEVNGVPTAPSEGTGNPWPGGPLSGSCANWPTAEAIERRIARSERASGRQSPLRGKGTLLMTLGGQYRVNPGVVVGLLQWASQLGADGSVLALAANNFGAMPGEGPCGSVMAGPRLYARYCSVEDGLNANVALLTGEPFSGTDGTLGAVLAAYGAGGDEIWGIMEAVASDLGITLSRETAVYADPVSCQQHGDAPPIPDQPPGTGMIPLEWSLHNVGARITQGPWGPWSHASCDCYDFGCPIGTPMYPILPGEVIVAQFTNGVYLPYVVVVRTAYGDLRYAHLNTLAVTVGQRVEIDTLLGHSGTAGTGPHLHLGLDGGTSSYTLDQVLRIAGFRLGTFPWSS